MNTVEDYKKNLQQRFTELVYQSEESIEDACGCGSGCGCQTSSGADEYHDEPGYRSYADLGLGTGMPTHHAGIKEGDTVVDLGSGAGIDCFLAREITGLAGKVIGVDMTEKMIEKARKNAEVAGYNNVEFRLGDIENLPVNDKTAQIVIGNGVMSLPPEETKEFSEGKSGIYSITISAEKPCCHAGEEDHVCCGNH